MSGRLLALSLALHRATVCHLLPKTTGPVSTVPPTCSISQWPCSYDMCLSCVFERSLRSHALLLPCNNVDVDQDYWHGRIWAPMIQITYWGLEQYSSPEARGAAAGLVAQSRALLLRNWLPEPHFTANDSAAGLGSYTLQTMPRIFRKSKLNSCY